MGRVRRPVNLKKGLEKEIDSVWSEYIRKRDKFCQMCGSPGPLAAHHSYGRTHRSLRYSPLNGVALCWPCHKFRAHGDPSGYHNWFRNHIGVINNDKLVMEYNRVVKRTPEELKQILSDLKKKLEEL